MSARLNTGPPPEGGVLYLPEHLLPATPELARLMLLEMRERLARDGVRVEVTRVNRRRLPWPGRWRRSR